MKNSMKNLSSKVEPIQSKYEQCENLRNLIIFLEQNSEFTKLPTTILFNTEQGKMDQIPLLFSRYQKIIELYRSKRKQSIRHQRVTSKTSHSVLVCTNKIVRLLNELFRTTCDSQRQKPNRRTKQGIAWKRARAKWVSIRLTSRNPMLQQSCCANFKGESQLRI